MIEKQLEVEVLKRHAHGSDAHKAFMLLIKGASFGEGEQVNSSFDEPEGAQICREALQLLLGVEVLT